MAEREILEFPGWIDRTLVDRQSGGCEDGRAMTTVSTHVFLAFRCFPALCVLFLCVSPSRAQWEPAPLTVHEWGVAEFRWDSGARNPPDLPDFLHTDKNPGKEVARPEIRVRDLPPTPLIRTKPILYVYESPDPSGRGTTKIGLEMRFAYGHAIAWWPQVNHYRNETGSTAAPPPDWPGWTAEALDRCTPFLLRYGANLTHWQKGKEALDEYGELEPLVQRLWLRRFTGFTGGLKLPEDKRMQLVWDQLTLHSSPIEGQVLPGAELPDEHWVKIAREVDAAYVSNGTEIERFVFYEGSTREQPMIALLPEKPRNFGANAEDQKKEVAIINIGAHPIFDVMAIYRDRKKGILWTGFVPMLPARFPIPLEVGQSVALRVPDFSKPEPDDVIDLEEAEFTRRTRERLLENLTAGYHYDPGRVD